MAALHKTDEAGRGEGDGWDSHLHPEPNPNPNPNPNLLGWPQPALKPVHEPEGGVEGNSYKPVSDIDKRVRFANNRLIRDEWLSGWPGLAFATARCC
jgi:hypothetical protein